MCSCSQVAKEAVALTAKKKEAMDEEQRRVEERHREELRQHQEDLAKQQKLLREQEATLEAARREQALRVERQREEQESDNRMLCDLVHIRINRLHVVCFIRATL